MFRVLLAALLLTVALPARAADRVICVYDPAGRTGFIYALMESWRVRSAAWGPSIELRPYTDEATAVNDFNAKKCDGVAASGVRLQRFVPAAYTVEAVGGLPDYALQKRSLTALQTMDAYQPLFTSGAYRVAGLLPLGAVYAMTRDRSIDTLAEMSGKRIATMDYDTASSTAVKKLGGLLRPTDLTTLGPMFNNGEVDLCFMTATGYGPFELWRGIGDKGGVLRYPLSMVTLQVLVHGDRFDEAWAKQSRAASAAMFDEGLASVKRAESDIAAKVWVELTPQAKAALDEFFQRLRVQLRDEAHSYDPKVLNLLFKARCNADPSRAECAQSLE